MEHMGKNPHTSKIVWIQETLYSSSHNHSVENGSLEDEWLVSKSAIFHFQDRLEIEYFHQPFQVPKMEVLCLIRLFWGARGFPYISRIYTAYIGEDSSILGTWNSWSPAKS